MDSLDKAFATQKKNVEAKTGKSLAELTKILNDSPLTKHSELRKMAQEKFGLGYGDANMLVRWAKEAASGGKEESLDEIVAGYYSGSKEGLRPLHDAVMKKIRALGDFNIAPKKTYLSLRRKKQFAMVGPGTRGRLEIGLNMKGLDGTDRLEALPPGGMCQYRVYLRDLSDVDDELMRWVKTAYESAG